MEFWKRRKADKEESEAIGEGSFIDRLGLLVRKRTTALAEHARAQEARELERIEHELIFQVETRRQQEAAVERRRKTLDMAWVAFELLRQNETQPEHWIDQVPQLETNKRARKRPETGRRVGRFALDGWLLDRAKDSELIIASDRDSPLAIVECNKEVDGVIAKRLHDDLQTSKEYKEYITMCELRGRAVVNRIRNEHYLSPDKRPALRRDLVAPSKAKEKQTHDVLRQYLDDLVSVTAETYIKTPLTLSNIPETTEYLAETMQVVSEEVDEQIQLKIAELLAKNNIEV